MQICCWGGLPCDCSTFPYLRNGIVPPKCEAQMPDELLGVRKVSDKGKARFRAYQAELSRTKTGGGPERAPASVSQFKSR
jgi:hypothetical protein